MELAAIIALLEQYRYFVLFPLACLEGPILGFIAGTLIPLGYFYPVPLLATLILADVIPDITYYYLGRWGHNRVWVQKFIAKLRVTPERLDLLHRLWHTHTAKAMLVTKFSYGLSTPLLLTAGLVQLPFSRFWKWSAFLAACQYTVLVSLGYFFGEYFTKVQSSLVRGQMIIAAAAVVFILYYFFTNSIRKKFLKKDLHG